MLTRKLRPFGLVLHLTAWRFRFLETVLPAVLLMRYPPNRVQKSTVSGSGGQSGRVILLARPLDARLPSCFAFAQTDAVAALGGATGTRPHPCEACPFHCTRNRRGGHWPCAVCIQWACGGSTSSHGFHLMGTFSKSDAVTCARNPHYPLRKSPLTFHHHHLQGPRWIQTRIFAHSIWEKPLQC